MEDDREVRHWFSQAFRTFVELFSFIAAATLFTSAYVQHRIFAEMHIPFFLVASTEDIVLGGFNILAITVDYLFSGRFWYALPLNALVLLIALYLAMVMARALRRGSGRARLAVLASAIVAMIFARSIASDMGSAIGGLFGHAAGQAVGRALPPLSNVVASPNDLLRFFLIWAATLALPLGLAIWAARRFWGQVFPRIELLDFARSVGWGIIIVALLLLGATTLPGQIARNFQWGKGRVAWQTADIRGQCAGGDLYAVWSGSKAEILRCSRPSGDSDFILIRGENILLDQREQNVRYGGQMTPVGDGAKPAEDDDSLARPTLPKAPQQGLRFPEAPPAK